MFLLLVCGCLSLVVCAVADADSSSACAAKGFVEPMCSVCHEMATCVSDAITRECLTCCVDDRGQEPDVFHSAVLVVDLDRLASWPMIQSFVNKKAPLFADRLKVVNRPFWRPVLELQDANEITQQTLDVQSWEPHQLSQFLEERVKRV